MPSYAEAREALGRQMRAYRERRGFTQEELADRIDPPPSVDTISKLERGRTRPYRHTLESLCAVLELDAAEQAAVFATWRGALPGGTLSREHARQDALPS